MLKIPTYVLHLILLFMVLFIINGERKERRSHMADTAAVEAARAAEEAVHAKLKEDATPNIESQSGTDPSRSINNHTAITYNSPKQQLSEETKQKFHEIAKNAKIYYVGVYESAQENEEQEKIFDQCQKQNEGRSTGDCHSYAYMQRRTDLKKAVTINVNVKQPIILVLSNYESVEWVVKGNTDQIKMIYATGYYGSEVHANLRQGEIYASFYQDNICSLCKMSYLNYISEYEYADKAKIFNYFGQDVSFFKGEYYGKVFYLD